MVSGAGLGAGALLQVLGETMLITPSRWWFISQFGEQQLLNMQDKVLMQSGFDHYQK
jgi:hypothetical protein